MGNRKKCTAHSITCPSMTYPGEVGYLSARWGYPSPVLARGAGQDWGTIWQDRTGVLPHLGLGYPPPPPGTGVPPGWDWNILLIGTGVPLSPPATPWLELGYPPRGDLGPVAGVPHPQKGHGTSIMGWGWVPLLLCGQTDRSKYKHYLPVVLCTRAVKKKGIATGY